MVTIVTVDEQVETKKRQYELLVTIWGVLRGVAIGAPLDADYANDLSERLDKEFELT